MINTQSIFSRVRTRTSDLENISFSTADLVYLLQGAVETYNRYKPLKKYGTLTTAAATDTYTAPADIDSIEVIGFTNDLFNYPLPLAEQYFPLDYFSVSLIWDSTAYKIKIDPMPYTVMTFNYVYTTPHVSDTSGNYPTIPYQDGGILVNLMLADIYDTVSLELEKQGITQAGDSRMDPSPSIKALRVAAHHTRTEAISQLDQGVAAMRA